MDSIVQTMDRLVPITEFNRGGAGRIFAEVAKTGPKIVVKNNAPTCVLLSPADYKEMIDEIEDAKLALLAAQRLADPAGKLYTQEEMLTLQGFTSDDLAEVEVDFE